MARLRMRRNRGERVPFRLPRVSLRVLLPNLVTMLALCAGLTAVRLAIEARIEPALIAILIASLLDGMDGRLARFLKGTSRFGAELDSLADFVNFGVAPGVILYVTFLRDYRSLGWIVVLIFAIAMALRLARFNVETDAENKPAWHARFFSGIPAPAGALCVLLPLYLEHAWIAHENIPSILVLLYTLIIAFLTISRVPAFSGKSLQVNVKREYVAMLIIGLIALISLLVAYTFESLSVLTLLYLAVLPVSSLTYTRLKKNAA
jgi:CDP-diacylglycerol--serine O-phosphatidyltransferase